MKPILLALQFCPIDSAQAIELTRLICDIEPQSRATEFCLAVRRDTPQEHVDTAARLAALKFSRVTVVRGERAGVGWPEGPNDLWAETMMRVSLAKKQGHIQADAVLTFEADCVPLRADWIDVLEAAWDGAQSRGKRVCGHAHGEPPDHINGNAIFEIGLLRRHPDLYNSNQRKGWDAHHGGLLLTIGEDTDAITQVYNLRDYTRQTLEAQRKGGKIPALFHGAKGPGGVRYAREMLNDGTLNKAALAGGNPGFRSYPAPTRKVGADARMGVVGNQAAGAFSGSL